MVGFGARLLYEGEAHRVGHRLAVGVVDVWDEVALDSHFLIELVLGVAEASCLFDAVPLLGALAVAMGPPSGTGLGLS